VPKEPWRRGGGRLGESSLGDTRIGKVGEERREWTRSVWEKRGK
jgi:hypothetical protein